MQAGLPYHFDKTNEFNHRENNGLQWSVSNHIDRYEPSVEQKLAKMPSKVANGLAVEVERKVREGYTLRGNYYQINSQKLKSVRVT
eukprot:5861578-Amphidinium_carterae.1